jgi:hypothetical protein
MLSAVKNNSLQNSESAKCYRVPLGRYLLFALSLVACGCTYREKADSANASNLEPVKTANNDVVYEHDFGLIRPGDEVSHRFEIVNSTDVPWKVQEIQTNCSCTVPTISSDVFQPGERGWVDVVYQAAKSESDDKRSVYAVFAEPGPKIPLTVKAKIRGPISIPQKEIVLETPYQQKGKEYFLEVKNYDEHAWDSLQLATKADWFAVESHKLSAIPPEAGLREIWRVVVTPKAEHLEPNWYQEMLEITANERIKAMPVRLRVLSKVEISPEMLFFGILEPDSEMKKVLLLRFREDIIPEVEVSCDLGDAVSWKWVKQEFPIWMLEVGLTTGSSAGIMEGVLTLKFSDADIEDKKISIKAMIQ